jgi:uncharacterized protein YraI
MMKTKLLAAGAALILSGAVAAAAPATVSTDLNMRSGPGTEYGVVTTIPAGAIVDVGGCTGSWCEVSFRGASGFASASYLSGAPSAAVVVPDYGPGYAYGDDYYDDSFSYGPSVGFYAGPRWRHGWHGRWRGRPGWHGHRTGNWQGRPGWQSGNRVGTIGNQPGRAARTGPAGRTSATPGSVSPMTAAPGAGAAGAQVSASAGLRSGGAAVGADGGARMGGAPVAGGGVQR